MFTGQNKGSNSTTKADLRLLIHSLSLRSAGGRDAAHFTTCLSRGERSCLQPPSVVIISRERSPAPAVLLHAILLFNSEGEGTGSKIRCFSGIRLPPTPSREQLLANPFLSGLKQGLAGTVRTLVPPQTGRLCARSRRQAGETERKSLPLVTNLFFWRTRQSRQQVRASCSRHCDSGQNMSPRQLTRGFPCYSRQDTSAGDTGSSFNCQTEKTSFYLELF